MSSSTYGDSIGSPSEFAPKTSLVRELLAIRKRVVDAGQPLLSLDEIQDEVEARRGRRNL